MREQDGYGYAEPYSNPYRGPSTYPGRFDTRFPANVTRPVDHTGSPAQRHRREISDIISKSQELLDDPILPEQRSLEHAKKASWRSVQPDMLESQREELDEEEMEVYRNAFAAAKARYAEENHSVYTAAYDKAKEVHTMVNPERTRRHWGPGPGQYGLPAPFERSPSPARPEAITALSRDSGSLWLELSPSPEKEELPEKSREALEAATSRLDCSVFQILHAGFKADLRTTPDVALDVPYRGTKLPLEFHDELLGPAVPAPSRPGPDVNRPNTGTWRDYLI